MMNMSAALTLKVLRQARKMSQWELGRRAGIPNHKISLFEQGWKQPKPEEIKKIAKGLNCDPSELAEIILKKD